MSLVFSARPLRSETQECRGGPRRMVRVDLGKMAGPERTHVVDARAEMPSERCRRPGRGERLVFQREQSSSVERGRARHRVVARSTLEHEIVEDRADPRIDACQRIAGTVLGLPRRRSPSGRLADQLSADARSVQIAGAEGCVEHQGEEGCVAPGAFGRRGVGRTLSRAHGERLGPVADGLDLVGRDDQARSMAAGRGEDERRVGAAKAQCTEIPHTDRLESSEEQGGLTSRDRQTKALHPSTRPQLAPSAEQSVGVTDEPVGQQQQRALHLSIGRESA